jgi:uncharacterized membrane protein HdeD (DUF308 family)
MFVFKQIDSFSQQSAGFGGGMIASGILLILGGFVIIEHPEILAFIFAGFVILAGMFLLSIGLRMKQASKGSPTVIINQKDFD